MRKLSHCLLIALFAGTAMPLSAGENDDLGLGAAASWASAAKKSTTFERYGHIERFKIASKATGRMYSIEIFRPASYDTSPHAYPALFVLDGNYAFDAIVALSSYMQRGEIKEHVIVGVSSDVPFGPPLAAVRTPDFTPPTKDGIMTRDAPSAYYGFLKDELMPEIGRRMRVEPDEKTLWGYSLSGSFVTWLNYYDRSLFRNYILASPNWGQFGIQQLLGEGKVFNAAGAVQRKLFISFDLNAEMPGVPDPEGRFRGFATPGAAPGYKVGYVLTRGETHTTSWFATLPAALRFVYAAD
jgi:hypothetical protein